MLYFVRPSFKVVEEGLILNKTKHLQNQFVGVFYLVPALSFILPMEPQETFKLKQNNNIFPFILFISNIPNIFVNKNTNSITYGTN